ncbi:hypothetical protein BGW36DRAFT_422101 [Talaromyces proteolyticus]|uniref:Rhodopsin domain-containing protein n=1 Tax=Talaromyces proteolyticus TaxID=1131652 RepID=A0AAD4L412_9EURO|nr:uncharacterized protein BGW36DRAFT_422101 [Talaromyces proteolyticus]KAH8705547.1 hypothetical protein BGW36DRAFT_422101 [Talaromyces proteolyticus]
MAPDMLSQLLDHPSQSPPPGVTPNFINPDSIAYQVYITAGVSIPLILAFPLLRVISKIHCLSGGAFGRHAWDVLLGSFTKPQLVLALLVEITGPLAICAVKISVLVLYLHIFGVLNWMRISSIASMIFIGAFHVSLSIAFAAMCAPSPSSGPSRLNFLTAFISESCTYTRILVVYQGVANVIIDIFLLVLPLPAIWTMQMPLRRKITTSAMFSIGLCACLSSIIGLVYRVRYYSISSDNTYLVVPVWATSMGEMTAGVMVCCMPSIAIVFKLVRRPILSGLSSAGQRLTGSSILTSSRSRKGTDINPNGPYFNLGSDSSHQIWIDTEANTYSLPHLNLGNAGIGKKIDFDVSQAA